MFRTIRPASDLQNANVVAINPVANKYLVNKAAKAAMLIKDNVIIVSDKANNPKEIYKSVDTSEGIGLVDITSMFSKIPTMEELFSIAKQAIVEQGTYIWE